MHWQGDVFEPQGCSWEMGLTGLLVPTAAVAAPHIDVARVVEVVERMWCDCKGCMDLAQ
jgi:hypothetical protein